MSLKYFCKRILLFFVTILAAATLNFIVPRLTPQDPITAVLGNMASKGVQLSNAQPLVEMYTKAFGLDKPVYIQYLLYIKNIFLHFDFGYSIAYYPSKVLPIILNAAPWTIGLLVAGNLIAFLIGNLLGALCAWKKTPKALRSLIYILMPFSTIPYYVLALILMYCLAVINPIFPISGVSTVGSVRNLSWGYIRDIIYHAALPLLSIVLSLVGFWALSMRGIMSTVLGEDYLSYAEARGLHSSHIFYHYGIKNAVLPQYTAIAIDFGKIMCGSVLVEIIFNYPGVGYVLYNSLRNADYFVMQGVIMFIIFTVALATLIMDLIYPLLDPRIRYD